MVLHGTAAQLDAAQPWLLLQRRLTAPAGRRYLVGWAAVARCTCSRPGCSRSGRRTSRARSSCSCWRRRRCSRAARRGEPPGLPAAVRAAHVPPLAALGVARGGRGAVLLRADPPRPPGRRAPSARAGAAVVPPGRRDATLLGGTVFDLLAREEGEPPVWRWPAGRTRRRARRARPAFHGRRCGTPRRRGARTSRAWRRPPDAGRPEHAPRHARRRSAPRSRPRAAPAPSPRPMRGAPSPAARGARAARAGGEDLAGDGRLPRPGRGCPAGRWPGSRARRSRPNGASATARPPRAAGPR